MKLISAITVVTAYSTCVVHGLSVIGQAPAIQRHQRNVEAGLLPAVVVKGDVASGHSLSEEMARLHVPGVSITVIHEGRIEWSKGYGVTNKAERLLLQIRSSKLGPSANPLPPSASCD